MREAQADPGLVAKRRVALAVMAQDDHRDARWVPAPLQFADPPRPIRGATLSSCAITVPLGRGKVLKGCPFWSFRNRTEHPHARFNPGDRATLSWPGLASWAITSA